MKIICFTVLLIIFSSYVYTQNEYFNESLIMQYTDWISQGNPDILTRSVPEYIPDHTGIVDGLIVNHKLEALPGVIVSIGEVSDTTSVDGTFRIITESGLQEIRCYLEEYNEFVNAIEVIKNDLVTYVIELSPAFWPPCNLVASCNPPSINVLLQWDEPVLPEGEIIELIYDNDISTGSYSYIGNSMCTLMSPEYPCQILELKFHTEMGIEFNAEVWGWDNYPTEDLYYQELITDVAINDWNIIDVSDEFLYMDGDFIVGFGSINSETNLSYDGSFDNGRSWDHDDTGGWSTWFQTYLIRAVVLYNNGRIEEISSISRDLIEYNVYRWDELLGSTNSTFYLDEGVPCGYIWYHITALYSDPTGESGPSNIAEIELVNTEYDDIPLTNLIGNYPNPFNPINTISFSIRSQCNLNLSVYNLKGQLVKTLIDKECNAGYHTAQWDGKDVNNIDVKSGVYFYKLIIDYEEEQFSKCVLLK
jgi:type IX secretion system substrate protein